MISPAWDGGPASTVSSGARLQISVSGAIAGVPAAVSAAQLVAAMLRVIADDGEKLFEHEDEGRCWTTTLDTHGSEPPGALISRIRSAARKMCSADCKSETCGPPNSSACWRIGA